MVQANKLRKKNIPKSSLASEMYIVHTVKRFSVRKTFNSTFHVFSEDDVKCDRHINLEMIRFFSALHSILLHKFLRLLQCIREITFYLIKHCVISNI